MKSFAMIVAGSLVTATGVLCSPFVIPSLNPLFCLLGGMTTGIGVGLILIGIFGPENGQDG